jgi:hypothetical protein
MPSAVTTTCESGLSGDTQSGERSDLECPAFTGHHVQTLRTMLGELWLCPIKRLPARLQGGLNILSAIVDFGARED